MLEATRSPRRLVPLLALALAGSCSPTVSDGLRPDVKASDADPWIEIERGEAGRWRATYHLARPATTLRFSRSAQWFRESTWTVLSPGYVLGRDGNSQILTTTNGTTPVDTIAVELSPHTQAMEGEYRPMLNFSDGSLAVFTGHLYLHDVADEVLDDDAPYVQTLSVTAPANTTVLLSGSVLETGETKRWRDPSGAGTYVYLSAPGSRSEPVESDDMIAVLDPSLPDAVAAEIRRVLPRMFALLTEAFDSPLPWRPMILVAWAPNHAGARAWEGSARPGVIAMSLGGSWELDEPGVLLELAQFVGHEASHFWNGVLIRNRGDDAWLHEGSADAFADLLLHRLALIDGEMLRARQERAINHCLRLLNGSTLSEAEARHGRKVHYSCGYMMAIWSDAAVGAPDLFAIWKALIDRVRADAEYDASSYFAVLRQLGAAPVVVEQMELALVSSSDVQRDRVIDGFGRAGLNLTPIDRPPTDERELLAAEALIHLQQANCGQTSVISGPTRLESLPLVDCEPFSRAVEIHAIAGHTLADGDRAHDAVRRACASGGTIVLSGPNSETRVRARCDQALAEPLPWLSLPRSNSAPQAPQ